MKKECQNPLVFRYFLVLFLLASLLVARLFWPFLSILILSFLLTGIFQPVFAFLNRQVSKNLASLLTCIIIIILVFVPMILFIGALSREAVDLYQLVKGTNISMKLQELLHESPLLLRTQEVAKAFGYELQPEGVSTTLGNFAKIVGLYFFNHAGAWSGNLMTFVFDFFMMILIIFFLLIDHHLLANYIVRLSPLPDRQVRHLIQKFRDMAGAVLVGNGVCALIQGVFGGLAFIFIGFGSPILWGGIVGVLAVLPLVGGGIVMLPAIGILLLQGKVASGLLLFIVYILFSFTIEYLIKPKIVGQQVKMHTLLVFLAILGGLSVFGILGIIYGPLIVTAFLTLADIYLEDYDPLFRKAPGC